MRRRRFPGLAIENGGQELRQEGGVIVEDGVDIRRAIARLVFIHQGFVGRQAELLGFRLRHLAHQADDRLEMRLHQREIGLGAGLAPDALAGGRSLAQRLHEIGAQGRGMDMGALHLMEIGALPGIEAGGLLGRRGQEVAGLGLHQQLVRDHAQGRQLLAAGAVPAFRHHRRHVPVEHARGIAQGRPAAEALLQILVGPHRIQIGRVLAHRWPRSRSSFRWKMTYTTASESASNAQVIAYCRWSFGRLIRVCPPIGNPPGLGARSASR